MKKERYAGFQLYILIILLPVTANEGGKTGKGIASHAAQLMEKGGRKVRRRTTTVGTA